jgi:hypothetical protein
MADYKFLYPAKSVELAVFWPDIGFAFIEGCENKTNQNLDFMDRN